MRTKQRRLFRSKTPIFNSQPVLDANFGHKVSKRTVDAAVAKLELDGEAVDGSGVTALDAAVAAILLASVRDDESEDADE